MFPDCRNFKPFEKNIVFLEKKMETIIFTEEIMMSGLMGLAGIVIAGLLWLGITINF